jgi:glycosyltransferase involved in cell wall biosynthesis
LPGILVAAKLELEHCLRRELARPQGSRADFVFTYHNYYKAPDLIGPQLAKGLKIPYVIAESSRSPGRADGPWAEAHALAEHASDAAALILTPTARDAVMLERHRPRHQRVIRLKPFIDMAEWPDSGNTRDDRPARPVRLFTVAMMRPGVKIESYQLLASALHRVAAQDWVLDIVGDGDGRAEVERLFEGFGSKVTFHGAIADKTTLGAFYGRADLFVWPGVGEAIGMVYLEAQMHGLKCLAYGYGGVADAVADGISGFLVPPGEETSFVEKLAVLMRPVADRQAQREALRAHVEQFHSLQAATRVCAEAFTRIGVNLPAVEATNAERPDGMNLDASHDRR